MLRSKLRFFCLSFCLAFPVVAQRRTNVSGGKLRSEQACFDVKHYELRLSIDPVQKSIEGSLRMKAIVTEDTERIELDLDERLAVSRLSSAGVDVEFEHEDGRIKIALPMKLEKGAELDILVAYSGVPRVAPRPPWSGGFTWDETKKGKPWIATSCQMEGADLWWPCKDHPSDKPENMDLFITVPKALYCASNGRLVKISKEGAKRVFHWRISTPISNYAVALNIAPYKVLERSYTSVTGEKVETFFFALPESVSKAKKAFPQFLKHLRFMEEICGPYPFRADKYAIVETPHLGMEHQSIIAYGNKYRYSKDGYDWLHHHEMSHEWWANLVTARDWKDMWIHEGIGTYMQALYMEELRGRAAYLQAMQRTGRHGNRLAVAPRETRDSKQISRGHDIYNKGSWFMHTMRWLMGDKKFFVALRRMAYPDPKMETVTDGSSVRLVDTEEIRAIAEKYHGADLEWFFEVYLRQPRLPELLSRHEGGKLHLEWKLPIEVEFPMPVQVKLRGKLLRVEMPEGTAVLDVPKGAKFEIDPDRLILKKEPRRRRRRRR